MSQSTKRKHVTKEVLDEFRLPINNETIVQVLAGRGNNLHEVYDPSLKNTESTDTTITINANRYLVSMPVKFRKNVWIKRGDYVVVEPIAEGDKVKAEIVQILYKEQIKYIKDQGQWPTEFLENTQGEDSKKAIGKTPKEIPDTISDRHDEGEEESDDESDLFQNTNRPKVDIVMESSESSSSEGE